MVGTMRYSENFDKLLVELLLSRDNSKKPR